MRLVRSFAVLLAAIALGGCDWAQFGFDATHGGFNPYEPALTTDTVTHLTQAWHRDGVFAPVVADGHVFVLDDQTTSVNLYALDPASGAVQWHDTLGGPGTVAFNAVVANSTLYFLFATFSPLQTSLHAYDVATGALKWATNPATGPAECKVGDAPSPVTVGAGNVVFTAYTSATQTGAVCAFDAATGTFQWSRSFAGESFTGTPALANGRVYAASHAFANLAAAKVRALSATTGATVWARTASNAGGSGSVVVAGSHVLVAAGTLLTFDATTGTPGWTSSANAVAATGDTVIAVEPGAVRALALNNGAELWSILGPSATEYSTPAIAGDIAYVASRQVFASDTQCCAHVDLLRLDSGGRVATISTDTRVTPSAIVSGGSIIVDSIGVTAYRP
jgi:outer membrane protein assembly factor BamB